MYVMLEKNDLRFGPQVVTGRFPVPHSQAATTRARWTSTPRRSAPLCGWRNADEGIYPQKKIIAIITSQHSSYGTIIHIAIIKLYTYGKHSP